MKKSVAFMLAALLLLPLAAAQKKSEKGTKAKSLEVSFQYQRQNTHGSNQFAVWIEDAKGQVVKTLFVTQFTAKGRVRGDEKPMRGYVKRPYCVPTWVKDVNAEALSDKQIDAFTGATPQESGIQTFTWDFTDQQGHKVKPGIYQVFVEATLFDPSSVLFKGTFSTKDPATSSVAFTSTYTVPEDDHKGMVTAVTAVLK